MYRSSYQITVASQNWLSEDQKYQIGSDLKHYYFWLHELWRNASAVDRCLQTHNVFSDHTNINSPWNNREELD